jgi:hypothetical protein
MARVGAAGAGATGIGAAAADLAAIATAGDVIEEGSATTRAPVGAGVAANGVGEGSAAVAGDGCTEMLASAMRVAMTAGVSLLPASKMLLSTRTRRSARRGDGMVPRGTGRKVPVTPLKRHAMSIDAKGR